MEVQMGKVWPKRGGQERPKEHTSTRAQEGPKSPDDDDDDDGGGFQEGPKRAEERPKGSPREPKRDPGEARGEPGGPSRRIRGGHVPQTRGSA